MNVLVTISCIPKWCLCQIFGALHVAFFFLILSTATSGYFSPHTVTALSPYIRRPLDFYWISLGLETLKEVHGSIPWAHLFCFLFFRYYYPSLSDTYWLENYIFIYFALFWELFQMGGVSSTPSLLKMKMSPHIFKVTFEMNDL